jgi:hypothetical protein
MSGLKLFYLDFKVLAVQIHGLPEKYYLEIQIFLYIALYSIKYT